VIRGKDGIGAIIIFSKDGSAVQGDLLSIFAYGIGILQLISQLKKDFHLVEQPWYADNAGADRKFDRIQSQSLQLVELGSTFIGEPTALNKWLEGKIQHWTATVAGLALAVANFPQSSYSGLQWLLQQEWQFVHQRVVKNIGEKFPDVQKELFLLALFDDTINSDDRCLASQSNMPLPNPVLSADKNYEQASILSSSHILAASSGVGEFRSADHIGILRSEM
jgi:hypothetical protein